MGDTNYNSRRHGGKERRHRGHAYDHNNTEEEEEEEDDGLAERVGSMSLEPPNHTNNRLSSGFKKYTSDFFREGKVFKVYWPEPAGNCFNGTVITGQRAVITGHYEQQIYAKPRWFVVVKSEELWSHCLPIQTYQGKGVGKPNTVKRKHSIIYTGRRPPDPLEIEAPGPEERGMLDSIRVIQWRKSDKLDPNSRVNYAKIYPVEHYNPVYDFGDVDKEHIQKFLSQFWWVMRPSSNYYLGRQQPYSNTPSSSYVPPNRVVENQTPTQTNRGLELSGPRGTPSDEASSYSTYSANSSQPHYPQQYASGQAESYNQNPQAYMPYGNPMQQAQASPSGNYAYNAAPPYGGDQQLYRDPRSSYNSATQAYQTLQNADYGATPFQSPPPHYPTQYQYPTQGYGSGYNN